MGPEPPGRMGQVGRWDEGALRGGRSQDLNHASEGLVLRGQCQPLQLTCPRRGSPVEPTSWEPLSPLQAWKGALWLGVGSDSIWWEGNIFLGMFGSFPHRVSVPLLTVK